MKPLTFLAALLCGFTLTQSFSAPSRPDDGEGQLLAATPHYQKMWTKGAKQVLAAAERVLERYRIKTDAIDRENGVLVTAVAPLKRIPEAEADVSGLGSKSRSEFVLYLFAPTWQSPGVLEASTKIYTNAGGGNYKQVLGTGEIEAWFFRLMDRELGEVGVDYRPTPCVETPVRSDQSSTAEKDEIEDPVLVSHEDPSYPAAYERIDKEDQLSIKYLVNELGSVTPYKAFGNTEGSSQFVRAITQALVVWRFRPAMRAGCAIKIYVTDTFSFKAH